MSWVGLQSVIGAFLVFGRTYLLLLSPERNKVRKREQIGNRYNQVSHLTQDTNWKVTTLHLDITNESQEASSFLGGDHKAFINRRTRKHNKNKTEIT